MQPGVRSSTIRTEQRLPTYSPRSIWACVPSTPLLVDLAGVLIPLGLPETSLPRMSYMRSPASLSTVTSESRIRVSLHLTCTTHPVHTDFRLVFQHLHVDHHIFPVRNGTLVQYLFRCSPKQVLGSPRSSEGRPQVGQGAPTLLESAGSNSWQKRHRQNFECVCRWIHIG